MNAATRGTGISVARCSLHGRNARGIAALFCCLVASVNCGDRPAPPPRDIVNDTTAAAARPSRGGPPSGSWPESRAEFLTIRVDDGDVAIAIATAGDIRIVRDAIALRERAIVDAFARGGFLGTDTIAATTGPTCGSTLDVRVGANRSWRVALERGRADAVPLDSIEALSARDSLARAITAATLAARAPYDTSEALRGIPYVVRGAWEFAPGAGRRGLVAIVSRTLALEADPRSEQVLLFAERESDTAEWKALLSERRAGPEGEVDTDDILAAIRFTESGRIGVIVERVGASDRQIVLYARSSDGTWTRRWSISLVSCVPS